MPKCYIDRTKYRIVLKFFNITVTIMRRHENPLFYRFHVFFCFFFPNLINLESLVAFAFYFNFGTGKDEILMRDQV